MPSSQHRGRPSFEELTSAWPRRRLGPMWSEQEEAFEVIAKHGSCTLEVPTGMGKTAIGYTTLKALGNRGEGPLFYIVPTKTLVGRVRCFQTSLRPMVGMSLIVSTTTVQGTKSLACYCRTVSIGSIKRLAGLLVEEQNVAPTTTPSTKPTRSGVGS